jgi:hypothetical protein
MKLTIDFVTFDSKEPRRLARWWADALGGAIDYESDGWAEVRAPGVTRLAFIKVREAKTLKNRVHLDIRAGDRAAEVRRLIELGATKIAEHGSGDYRWNVLQGPEANEFCVYAKEPQQRA